MSRLASILVSLVVVVLAGCATQEERLKAYEGELPAGRVAVIEAPTQLEIFEVSGVRVKTLFLGGKTYQVEAPAGAQTILVQYVASWGKSGAERSEEEVIRSESVRIDAQLLGGQRYRLAYQAPESLTEAAAFAEQPVIWLEDSNGSRVATGVIRPPSRQGALGRGPSAAAPDADKAAPSQGEAPSRGSAVLPQAPADTTQAFQRLQYWWEQATPADRAAFEAWSRQR